GLWRTNVADLSGYLADFLQVDALDHDLGLAGGLDRDAFRNGEVHRMREAEREVQYLALHCRAEAYALKLELLLVALGDAQDHVGEVRAGGASLCARKSRIRVLDLELLLRLHDGDTALKREAERALRAFDGHRFRRNRCGHALRQID